MKLITKKYTNIPITPKVAGSNSVDAGHRAIYQDRTLPPRDWVKYNTDALKNEMNKMTAINYVFRDTDENIIENDGRTMGDIPIF